MAIEMHQTTRVKPFKLSIKTILLLAVLFSGCALESPPECLDGDVLCVPTQCEQGAQTCNENQCTMQICQNGEWNTNNQSLCRFGFDDIRRSCLNPCDICESGYCPNTIQDKLSNTIYTCNENTGWSVDNSCFNDFVPEFDSEGSQPKINEQKFLEFVDSEVSDDTNFDFIFGHCGVCSQNTSPSFCSGSIDDGDESSVGKTVIHQCVNGQYETTAGNLFLCKEKLSCLNDTGDDCTQCSDEYGEITVNLKNNRNHCGECGKQCTSLQKCEDGHCKSNVVCDDKGYTQIQLGTRWINAYCIKDSDDLKKIGQLEDNYDQAYVLVDNIQLNEPWEPLSNRGGVLLFGNNKYISIKNGFTQTEAKDYQGNLSTSSGLFAELYNSYIENIHLHYLVDNKEIDKVDYFGLLAAQSSNSRIRNIEITTETPITIKSTIAAGSLFGIAGQGTSIDGVKVHVEISAKNEAPKTDKPELDKTGIGGLIGIAKNIKEIKNIFHYSEDTAIKIHGYKNIGGLIGYMTRDIENYEPAIIDNSNASLASSDKKAPVIEISGEENLGGLIGIIEHNERATPYHIADIQNFNIGYIQMNLILITEDLIDKESMDVPRYLGGIIGKAQPSLSASDSIANFNNIQINSVQIDDNSPEDAKITSTHIGGFAGAIRYTSLNDINIYSVTFNHPQTITSTVGGLTGLAYDSTLTRTNVFNFSFISETNDCFSLAGLIGSSRDNIITNSFIGNKNLEDGSSSTDLNKKSIKIHCNAIHTSRDSVGGMIGNSESDRLNNIYIYNIELISTRPNPLSKLRAFPPQISRMGGLIGSAKNSSLSNISGYNIEISGCNEVGGVIGNAEMVEMNNIYVNSTLHTHMNSAGLIGYGSGDIKISDTRISTHIIPTIYDPHYSTSVSGLSGVISEIYSGNLHLSGVYSESFIETHPSATLEANSFIFSLPEDGSSTLEQVTTFSHIQNKNDSDKAAYYASNFVSINNVAITAALSFLNVSDTSYNNIQEKSSVSHTGYVKKSYSNTSQQAESYTNALYRCGNPSNYTYPTDNTGTKCIPLYHIMTCSIDGLKSALHCKDNACNGLLKNLKLTEDKNHFGLRIPISPQENYEPVCGKGITCENENSTASNVYEVIPLCDNGYSPSSCNHKPTESSNTWDNSCSDNSTPKCYKILRPYFCQ